MGTTIYRVTGIALSIIIALLGATIAVLLYYAGKDGVEIFYKDSTYKDEQNRIHKRMPTDDWYGILILRGWAFGFIYVVPGLTGITASLFFKKCPMVVHFIIGAAALFVGSFIHGAGALAFIIYRIFVVNGVLLKYDTWPFDCKYIRDDDPLDNVVYVDDRCTTGRRATLLLMAAAAVALVAWAFLLADLLYCGLTLHNSEKKDTTKSKTSERQGDDRPRRRPYRRRRTPPSEPTPATNTPSTSATNAAFEAVTGTPTETTPQLSTTEKEVSSSKADSLQTEVAMGKDATGISEADTLPRDDRPRDTTTALELEEVVQRL